MQFFIRSNIGILLIKIYLPILITSPLYLYISNIFITSFQLWLLCLLVILGIRIVSLSLSSFLFPCLIKCAKINFSTLILNTKRPLKLYYNLKKFLSIIKTERKTEKISKVQTTFRLSLNIKKANKTLLQFVIIVHACASKWRALQVFYGPIGVSQLAQKTRKVLRRNYENL